MRIIGHLSLIITHNTQQQLNVEVAEVEDLLIGLILEGKVEGKIDQVAMRLELDQQFVIFKCVLILYAQLSFCRQSLAKRRYTALSKWTGALENIHATVVSKAVSHQRGPEGGMGMGMRSDYEGVFPRDYDGRQW